MAAGKSLKAELVPVIQARIKTKFPSEYREFQLFAGMSVGEYLQNPDPALNQKLTGRLVELMLEYQPLTEQQRKKQRPEEVQRWAEADRIKARMEQLAARRNREIFQRAGLT